MKKQFIIEQVAETRWFYHFEEVNGKGEKITIELIKCISDLKYKNSLPNLWYKNGYINKVLETYWSIETYVTDTENNCYGRYNPQVKLSEDKKRNVINFEWMFEATEENKQKLIDEVLRIFLSAEGKTATEIKIENVLNFARQKGIEVVKEIPTGWQDIGGMTCPIGSTWISNMKSFKSGMRQTKLLLI